MGFCPQAGTAASVVVGPGDSETKLTPAESEQLGSLVAALLPGRCTSDGMFGPCVLTTLSVDAVSDTDWGQGCREASGPGTHLAGERAIVSFIDSLVPADVADSGDASAGGGAPVDSAPGR
jgi:hypothetical protein